MNAPTIIVGIIVLAVVGGALFRVIKKAKNGGSCGCDCGECNCGCGAKEKK